MLIVMNSQATSEQIDHVVERLSAIGAEAHVSRGEFRTVIGAIGDDAVIASIPLEVLDGVERVMPVLKPYKMVAKESHPDPAVVKIGDAAVGGDSFVVIAGPCAVETRGQTLKATQVVSDCGAQVLRGEAYKPRSSPYSFQGLGVDGLKIMAEAREQTGRPFVAEVLDARDVEVIGEYADAFRVGARNMANFTLLAELGTQRKPVILKRGLTSTIEEWLLAAEYIAKGGNDSIIFCERGIRTFEPATRFTLDISAIPVLKQETFLPVIVDPSHAAGRHYAVKPLALASVAVGADGIMIDVHPCPEEALCDGPQALLPDEFKDLMANIRPMLEIVGKHL